MNVTNKYPRSISSIYLSEIFDSIQGEGGLSGYRTLFIRLLGCHVGCKWCDSLLEGTLVRTSDNIWKPIESIKEGDEIIGLGSDTHSHNSRYCYTKAVASHLTNHKENKAIELTFSNGTKATSTFNHEFFTRKPSFKSRKNLNKWNYIEAENLQVGNEFWSIGESFNYKTTNDFVIGWLQGYDIGDGGWSNERKVNRRFDTITKEIFDRIIEYHKLLNIRYSILGERETVVKNKIYRIDSWLNLYNEKFENESEYIRGYISGFFDAEGSNNSTQAIFSNQNIKLLKQIKKWLTNFDFYDSYISEGRDVFCLNVRLDTVGRFEFDSIFNYAKKHNDKWLWGTNGIRGGVRKRKSVMSKNVVTLVSKKILKGNFKFYDIGSTSNNFIANGIVVHNTKYTWKVKEKNKIKVTDLVVEIKKRVDVDSWLCFTGGEPLEQLKSLVWVVEKLNNFGYKKISIETAGILGYKDTEVILPDQKDIVDLYYADTFFSVSPKLISALGKRFNYDSFVKIVRFWCETVPVYYKLQFKFVASTDEDLDILSSIIKDVPAMKASTIFLQIEDSRINSNYIEKCFNWVKKNQEYRMSVQQHKILKLK